MATSWRSGPTTPDNRGVTSLAGIAPRDQFKFTPARILNNAHVTNNNPVFDTQPLQNPANNQVLDTQPHQTMSFRTRRLFLAGEEPAFAFTFQRHANPHQPNH
jgi:hypothetical protein